MTSYLAALIMAAAATFMSVENGERVYRPHAEQCRILQAPQRFVAAIAGTGGGKTAIGPLWLMREIEKHPGAEWMVLAPTVKILKRATLPTLKRAFSGTPFHGIYRAGDGEYRLPDGGVIYCVSTHNPDSIEGGQIHAAWADEAGQMVRGAWIALQARLGVHMGRCLFTSTPYAVNWLKRDILDPVTRGDRDYFAHRWSSIANPAYPREEYERAKRTLPRPLFLMRYHGHFTLMEGRIFSEFDADFNVRPCLYHPDKTILVGSDFNVSPMAWVLCHRHGHQLEVFDEIYLRGTTTQRTLDYLHNRYANHKAGWQFYGDASGKARKTSAALSDYRQILNDPRFARAGRTVHYPDSNPRRADRFAACNAMFCAADGERRCFIDPSVVNLIGDLESRFYKTNSMDPDDRDADSGHATDALGYVVHRLFPIRTKPPETVQRVSIHV